MISIEEVNKDIILIPAKGHSVRCPGKNIKLLEWASNYLGEKSNRAIVITDSDDIIEESKKFNLHFFKSSITTNELSAMLDYLEKNNYKREYFIYLPLTQPLREIGLIDMLDDMETKKDFIVSKNKYINRDIFRISDNSFITQSFERKGCLCNRDNCIDGAIYKISVDFFKKVNSNNNVNHEFWNGDFETITNNMPFLDIDEIEDLNCFNNLLKLFNYENGNLYIDKR